MLLPCVRHETLPGDVYNVAGRVLLSMLGLASILCCQSRSTVVMPNAGSTLHVAGSAAVASAWPRSCSASAVNRPCRAPPPPRLPPRRRSPPWLLRAAWRSGARRPLSTRAAACRAGAGAGMLRPPTATPPLTVTSVSAPHHPHPSATRPAAAAA